MAFEARRTQRGRALGKPARKPSALIPLLHLRTRIILWIDVVDVPWTGAVELNNRGVVGEECVDVQSNAILTERRCEHVGDLTLDG